MTDRGSEVIERPTSRILVLDPADRILLFFAAIGHSIEPERRPDADGFWALPGGGLEPGESHLEAAVRELREETGILADASVLKLIATRDVHYPWKGRTYRSREQYFFARAPSGALDSSGWGAGDKRWMRHLGWWEIDDLVSTNDVVRPPGLAALAQRVRAGDLPVTPLVLPA
ncbi:MAG TPA: NUDIX domain-containing protein [Hyphomicrobiaceae bacterium]|nr:NUDIX domain-containing protein [Hyphomicrobiaceae bacterium]